MVHEAEAVRWLRLAARWGHADAQFKLGEYPQLVKADQPSPEETEARNIDMVRKVKIGMDVEQAEAILGPSLVTEVGSMRSHRWGDVSVMFQDGKAVLGFVDFPDGWKQIPLDPVNPDDVK